MKFLSKKGFNAENLHFNELSRTGGKGGLRTAVTPIRDFKLQNVSANADGVGVSSKSEFYVA